MDKRKAKKAEKASAALRDTDPKANARKVCVNLLLLLRRSNCFLPLPQRDVAHLVSEVDSGDESDGQSAARAIAAEQEKKRRGPLNQSEAEFEGPIKVVVSKNGNSEKRWQFKCRHCGAYVPFISSSRPSILIYSAQDTNSRTHTQWSNCPVEGRAS